MSYDPGHRVFILMNEVFFKFGKSKPILHGWDSKMSIYVLVVSKLNPAALARSVLAS